MNFKFTGSDSTFFKVLKIAAIAAISITAAYFFFTYLFVIFLPFIIAWLIAFFIQGPVAFMHTKMHMPHKFATIVFLLLLLTAIGFAGYFIISRTVYELKGLAENIQNNVSGDMVQDAIDSIFNTIENVAKGIPFIADSGVLNNLEATLTREIGNVMSSVGSDIAKNVPALAGQILGSLPGIVIFTVLTIVSTIYISLDYKVISKFLLIQIPPKVRTWILDIKTRFLEAIMKYLRAYAILIMITYFELTVGFLIIDVKYAFLLAGVVAIIDIFPVLGTGTVLIPWGILSLIQKDYYTGFALLILYATVAVIRNIIEPKIVGTSIGLYPVITLISMYVGYSLLGFAGMFMLPIAILIIKNLNSEGKIKLYKNVSDYDREQAEKIEREKVLEEKGKLPDTDKDKE
ncbi:sporulation integral membrane protein YtvI [Clostridia bacterium]|nr:sporulation integral membrane protein YtvI [Clostridia bacterium]